MPSPGFMYHPTNGKQVFPDLTPAFQKQLEGEGWFDSPDKMAAGRSPEYLDPASVVVTAPLAPAADIKDVGIDDLLPAAPPALGWLNDSDLTKDRLTSWLDKHGVSYKARDSKDDLIALVRANADKPTAE